MGFHAMTWAKQQTVGSSTRKLVLLVIADRVDDDSSETWVGQESIATEAELSVRTVGRVVAELEGLGLIERQQRRRPDGYRSSDLIRLNRHWTSPDSQSHESPSPEPVSHDELSGDTDDNLTGHPVQPHPTECRSKNQPVDQSVDQSDTPPLRLVAEQDASTVETATTRFEMHFWPIWPRRHGRRVGKKAALARWLKLSVNQQRQAVKGAQAYAAHCTSSKSYPKDAERWLRDRLWEEWMVDDPAPPEPSGVGSAAHLPNGGRVSFTGAEQADLMRSMVGGPA